jgi:alpha-tubulin suppressor-like RCC1 family protein
MVYGWGSNSNMQLSHQLEFGLVENPLLASFSPMRIDFNLADNRATDIAAGNEFSIFVTENKKNGETEVFGCGHNTHGEIGIFKSLEN